ncbi:MAG: DUF1573 domain-containing protein [Verrucomicrobiales bacterium]
MKLALPGCFFLLTLSLPAGLVFESAHIKSAARPAEAQHEVRIPFTAQGSQSISIQRIDSTCGCLSAKANKETFAAGDKGYITAIFKLGGFEGEVTKSLYVITDDPEHPKKHLTVSIMVPKLFEITPEVTSWTLGEEPAAKTVSFKVLQEKPVEITGVTSTRDNFKAEWKEVEKGRLYEITLTPTSTAQPVLGALRIETTSELPRYRHRMCFFNVLRPQPARTAIR